eukprot:56814-Eustigmatos_ZCMA.PRE.1
MPKVQGLWTLCSSMPHTPKLDAAAAAAAAAGPLCCGSSSTLRRGRSEGKEGPEKSKDCARLVDMRLLQMSDNKLIADKNETRTTTSDRVQGRRSHGDNGAGRGTHREEHCGGDPPAEMRVDSAQQKIMKIMKQTVARRHDAEGRGRASSPFEQ